MNLKPVHLASAALAASAAVALLVTGCSSNSSTTATGAPASSSVAAPGGGSAPSGGASSVTVDGKAIEGSFTTTCAKQGGTLALALADVNNGAYGRLAVSATVTGGNTVQAVGIAGTKGGSGGVGYALGFGNGMPGGSATLTKDGNTFKVTGEGVGAPDMTNPTAGPKNSKFAITFACSTVVGG
jgi:lipoprotein LpqH